MTSGFRDYFDPESSAVGPSCILIYLFPLPFIISFFLKIPGPPPRVPIIS